MKLAKKKTTAPVEVSLRDALENTRAKIREKREELAVLESQKRDIERDMFYEKTEYRAGDIVEVYTYKDTKSNEKGIVEGRLDIAQGYSQSFVAYPRKKDGEFSLRRHHVSLADIKRLVKRGSDER